MRPCAETDLKPPEAEKMGGEGSEVPEVLGESLEKRRGVRANPCPLVRALSEVNPEPMGG